MKINGFGVAGICLVVVFTTLAVGDVGSLYCEKPYIMEWDIVPKIALVTGLPLLLGYLWGREW